MYGGRFVFPHRFCLAKGPPRCPGRESNPGPTKWQASMLTIELSLTPIELCLTPLSYASLSRLQIIPSAPSFATWICADSYAVVAME